MLETNSEPGDAVRICTEGESASMLHQYFTDKDETDALSVRLGGEEWSEQLGLHFLADACTGIADFQHQWRGRSPDVDVSVCFYALCRVLDDID